MKNRSIHTDYSTITFKTRAINDFLADIDRYKLLTPEEEVELFEQYNNGDEKAGDKIICANLRFVYNVCAKFQNNGNILDLINCGVIGMKKALASFDAKRGLKFISYAVFQIRSEITNYYKDCHYLIRRPHTVSKYTEKVVEARDKFFQENEYIPTLEQLQEMLENEYNAHVIEKSDLIQSEFISFDRPIDNEGGTGSRIDEVGNIALTASSQNEYEEKEEDEDNKRLIAFLMEGLAEREKIIINLILEGYTFEKIADRFDVSGNNIRMIYQKAIDRMKKRGKLIDKVA